MVINFDRDAIVGALKELVDELVEIGASAQIRIVGGAANAVSYTRESTTIDIDALYGSASEVEQATRNIAQRHGWPIDWFNDDVKQFASHFDAAEDWLDLEVRDGVIVRVAGARLLLAMKLRAARGRRDAMDIDVLLDACAITAVEDAVALFEHYYPEDELSERARRQLVGRLSGVETT